MVRQMGKKLLASTLKSDRRSIFFRNIGHLLNLEEKKGGTDDVEVMGEEKEGKAVYDGCQNLSVGS